MNPDQALPPLLSLRGIVKRFGGFVANDHIDLDIAQGEAHALVGENGAGKSTLVKIIYGVLAPTEGTIAIDGEQVRLNSPEAARARGIGMVFQHFSLFDNLTVAENVALVLPRRESLAGLRARIAEVSRRYRMPLEPDRDVWSLSAGERQRIEIARCLLQDPRLVILDEPTSVLTPQEAYGLFETLDALKAEGRSLLYISHKLEEVQRLCERATILRLGRKVASCDPRQESPRSLAALMVGAQIAEIRPAAHAKGEVRLRVDALSAEAETLHGVDLAHVSLSVRGGEILGVAGVAGNGQAELFELLSGERTVERAETIIIGGAALGRGGVTARRLHGAAFVPEERNGHAAAPDFSLAQNVVLSRHATGGVVRRGLVRYERARELAQEIASAFDVRKTGPDPAARTLSGGNLQKFVVGREILGEPKVLIVNQPTWGVDAAASAAIRQALVDLAARGAAVLLISQDLDELFEICDSIAVIHDGRLSAPLDAHAATREEIGLLMTGATGGQQEDLHAH
ncbi:MAG: transporter related [Hyphomicrobiales bacterium]|nr:transporter related [Hyphomicrobiales bacterium]